MPIPPSLGTDADAERAAVVAQLVSIQATYKDTPGAFGNVDSEGNPITNNCYWQGTPVMSVVPDNGALTATDDTVKPTDRRETWNDVGMTVPATMASQVCVDVYNGTQGHGYVVRSIVRVGTTHYNKADNIGPETGRTHDWIESEVV